MRGTALLLTAALVVATCTGCEPQSGPGSVAWKRQASAYLAQRQALAGRCAAEERAPLQSESTLASSTQAYRSVYDEALALQPPQEAELAHRVFVSSLALRLDQAEAQLALQAADQKVLSFKGTRKYRRARRSPPALVERRGTLHVEISEYDALSMELSRLQRKALEQRAKWMRLKLKVGVADSNASHELKEFVAQYASELD